MMTVEEMRENAVKMAKLGKRNSDGFAAVVATILGSSAEICERQDRLDDRLRHLGIDVLERLEKPKHHYVCVCPDCEDEWEPNEPEESQ